MKRYCGRDFSADEIELIQRLIDTNPELRRAPLSRLLCERFGWVRPNRELKDMSCRVALLRMQNDGLIVLPPSSQPRPRGRPHFPPTPATDPQPRLERPVHELAPLTLRHLDGKPASLLWNEYIARYHYFGYMPMSGSQLRYNVFAGDQLVALLSFGACAWKLAAREQFIGWAEEARSRNLQRVVNNARFLILPWIQSKGLASKILALAARQLPHDWLRRYGYAPVLLETFVQSPPYLGTCYKAANWIRIGQTTGRGKKCPVKQPILPVKDIWLYPLRKDFRLILCR